MRIKCPKCERVLRMGDSLDGRRVKCPACGAAFPVQSRCRPRGDLQRPSGGSATHTETNDLCMRAASLRKQWDDRRKMDEAERLFRDAAQRSPDLWMPHFGLGEVLLFKSANLTIGERATVLEDEGLRELRMAASLDPGQPEPALKLAATLASSDIEAANEYYSQAWLAQQTSRFSLYPTDWQADDHFQFAIAAAEHDLHDTAEEAFCRAIQINGDYAGKYMPSSRKAKADWQTALRTSGKTEWFERQDDHEQFLAEAMGMPRSLLRLERSIDDFLHSDGLERYGLAERRANTAHWVSFALTLAALLVLIYGPLAHLAGWTQALLTALAPVASWLAGRVGHWLVMEFHRE